MPMSNGEGMRGLSSQGPGPKPKNSLDAKSLVQNVSKAIGRTKRVYEDGHVSGVNSNGSYNIQIGFREFPYDGVSSTNSKIKKVHGDPVRIGFLGGNPLLPFIIEVGQAKSLSGMGTVISPPVSSSGAIMWSQMEGDPELHHGRWTTNDVVPKIFVPMWNAGGFAPTEMFASKPTHELPFMEAGTPTEIGAYSPVYGFVMFPNKAGQQCLAHAYLDFNTSDNVAYMVVQCYNLADPTKSWVSSGAFATNYLFSEWDQTNNAKTEPNQKRMAYDKEFHQIVLFYSSYSNSLFAGMYLFDAENGFPHFSGLDGNKTVNNISFGKTSLMSAWWRSTRNVIPTVMVPNTVTSNPMIWLNPPTGSVDTSTINEEFVEIWKKTKVETLTDGVTYIDYAFTTKLLQTIISDLPEYLTIDCSSNNNHRWPYSRVSDAYAYAVIRGSGLDLSNQEHRMTLSTFVGYPPDSGIYQDVWTTPENPAVEISALSMNRYKYHESVRIDFRIFDSEGHEVYSDTKISLASESYYDSGTFEYISTAIPRDDGNTTIGDSFDVVSGYHVETVENPPANYAHYDITVEEYTTIIPGVTYSSTFLGYVAELSQSIVDDRQPWSWNTGGVTGELSDEPSRVEDWEDPTPIQYWAYGEGTHYHKEWGILPAHNGGTYQQYTESGTNTQGYTTATGTTINYPVLSILQGLPCVFPLPIRNNLVGWNARLFTPTDTSQPGGVPLPSNASGVFDDTGNYYIAYAMPEVWIRGCAREDRHFRVSKTTRVPFNVATLGRISFFSDYIGWRVVSALTGGVNEYVLGPNTYQITGMEVIHGGDSYGVQEEKYGMIPISETVYKTYLRKVKFTPGAVDSHGVQAPGAYATDWDINFSYYLQFISPPDTEGDYAQKPDGSQAPIMLDEYTSYYPLKWFPIVATPRPTLEQIWSITPIKAKVSPVNRLIMILDKRVNENIMIESVPFLYILDSESGNIIGNVDIADYYDEEIDFNDLGEGHYRKNYYYHEETTVSEAITARGGPEIIVNHDNLGNSIAIVKLWVEDRVTNEKHFKMTTLYFNQDGFTASQINVAEGTTGANGWNPYETLKALGSFKNCAFGDVIYFYDMVTRSFKKTSASLETWENTIIDTQASVTP